MFGAVSSIVYAISFSSVYLCAWLFSFAYINVPIETKLSPILVTFFGMAIFVKLLHSENA